jgi:hypothetical protein
MDALRNKGVLGPLVVAPPGADIIDCRWVFKLRSDGRHKGRLVARGFNQTYGVNFKDVFLPMLNYGTYCLIMALAAVEGYYITAVDVRNAYLNAPLSETIYMRQPEGFRVKGQETKVYKLRKALYGLKQAGREWWLALSQSMKELSFTALYSDAGVYIHKSADGNIVITLVYVDDALFLGSNKNYVNAIKAKFMKRWECRDLGEPKEFLGIHMHRKGKHTLEIDQCAYLEKVLECFGMQDCKPAPTPLPAGYKPTEYIGPLDKDIQKQFQVIIGSLLYLMLGTRPDVAYAVCKLAQFATNPSQDHVNKAKYICRYLAGTRHYKMIYNGTGQSGLIAYADASFNPVKDSSAKSQTGYCVLFANAPILWTSRRQVTTAQSTAEAEYMALSDCTKSVLWIRHIMEELGYHLTPIPICDDNHGAIHMSKNRVVHKRSKHIHPKYHLIRDAVELQQVSIEAVASEDNIADTFTKNLGRILFEKCQSGFGIEFKT